MTPLNVFRWCNLALTFALELAALAALSYAAACLGNGGAATVALAIAAPLVAVLFWQMFAAPRSIKHVPAAKVAVKLTVFGLATVGLIMYDHRMMGLLFAGTVVINALVVHATGMPTQTVEPNGRDVVRV
jgi:hypothetical protein